MKTTQNIGWQKARRLAAWCLIFLFAWGVWLWQLDIGSLTFDETATYFVANRPALEIVQYLRGAVQEHPPVYYLLIRGWIALTGTSEFNLRFFSAATAMLVLPLTGWLGRLATQMAARKHQANSAPGVDIGLIAAALLAAAAGMAYYARDARMYSLMAVWAALSAGLFLRDWLPTTKWPRKTAVFLLMLVNGLSLFTHYYLILPILTQPVTLLLTKRWRPLAAWCLSHIVPGLIGLLWLLLASGLQRTAVSAFTDSLPPLPTLSQISYLLDRLLFSPMIGVQPQLLAVLLILVLIGIAAALRQQWRVGVWLLMILPGSFLLSYLLPRSPQPRYLFYLLPFFFLAVAHAPLLAVRAGRFQLWRWTAVGAAVLIMMGFLFQAGMPQTLTLEKSRYGQTLAVVNAHARPGDELLFYGPWQIIPFYYYDPGGLPPITLLPPHAPPLLDPAEAQPVLEEIMGRATRLWVTTAAVDNVDPEGFVWRWLRRNAHRVWAGDEFYLYLPPLPADAPAQERNLTFGQTLSLERVQIEAESVPAGEPFRITLEWRPLQTLENGAELTLFLVNQAGIVWASYIADLEVNQNEAEIVDRHGFTLPAGAPPGEYTARIQVVNNDTGEILPAEGQELVNLLQLQLTEPAREPILQFVTETSRTEFCAPNGTDCLTLLGVEPGLRRSPPGYPAPFVLQWLAPSESLPDLTLHLEIVSDPWFSLPGVRRPAITVQTIPLAAAYPSSQWTAGRIVTAPLALSLPADAPATRAAITLQVVAPDGTIWQTAAGNETQSLFSIAIEERPTLRRLPAQLQPIQASFGDEIELRGYRVSGQACPGGQLQLTYGWYARRQPDAVYAVFNHLITADGEVAALADGWPQEGRLLTLQWQPGEYVEDTHMLEIPATAPPGPYTLYVGLYAAADGQRLPAFQENQRLMEDRVSIAISDNCR